jgi:hypothetical protein
MPARKKTVPESAAAPAETAPKPATRRAAAKKTEAPAGEPKPARRRTTAATHKSAARAAAAAAGAETVIAFDPARYAAEIQREAYFQWLNRGCAHGGDAGDWFRAVEIVKARHGF